VISTRKLVKNLVSTGSVTIVSAVAIMAIQVLVSRAYGSEVFGVYTLVLAIGRISLAAADVGIDTFVYREVSKDAEHTRDWVDTGLYLRARFAAAVVVGGLAVYWALGPHDQVGAALLLFVDLTAGDLAVMLSHVFIARRDAHLQAVVTIPTLALRVGGCAFAVAAHGELAVVATALLACNTGQLVWSYAIARRRGWASRPRAVHVQALLDGAWPIGVSNTVRALYFKLDSVLLAGMTTARDVGLYNAAYLLATGTTLASVVIRAVAFPELSSAFVAGAARGPQVRRVLGWFAFAIAAASAIAVAATWLLGPWVIDRFFGADFATSKALVPIFAIACAAIFANEAAQAVLVASNQQTLDLRCGIFALCLNVTLNLILIPRIGIAGAAWATLATEAAGATSRLWFGRGVIRTALAAV
jgi:O-antigen/teichoic acid export membrane protein